MAELPEQLVKPIDKAIYETDSDSIVVTASVLSFIYYRIALA